MASTPANEAATDQPSADGTITPFHRATCHAGSGNIGSEEEAWQAEESQIELPPGEVGLQRSRSAGDIERVLKYVPERRVCVQAGGAAGSYPKELKKHFDVVYTFEPNPVLFGYLCKNCPEPEIIKFPCALGNGPGMVHMAHNKEYKSNMGAWWTEEGGITPQLTLANFEFPALDLIYLDTEGSEGRILAGSLSTIGKHKPVIVAEHKHKIIKRIGSDWLEWFTESMGYEVADKIGNDVCLVSVT